MGETQRDEDVVVQSMIDHSAKLPQDIDESATARALAHMAVKHRLALGSDFMILVAAGTLLMRNHRQRRTADEKAGNAITSAEGEE